MLPQSNGLGTMVTSTSLLTCNDLNIEGDILSKVTVYYFKVKTVGMSQASN